MYKEKKANRFAKTGLILINVLTAVYLFFYIVNYFKDKEPVYFKLSYGESLESKKDSLIAIRELLQLENIITESRNRYVVPLALSLNNRNIYDSYENISVHMNGNILVYKMENTIIEYSSIIEFIDDYALRSNKALLLDSLSLAFHSAVLFNRLKEHDCINYWLSTGKIDSLEFKKERKHLLDSEKRRSLRVNIRNFFQAVVLKDYDQALKYCANCYALDKNNGVIYFLLSKIPLEMSYRFGFSSREEILLEALKNHNRNYFLLKGLERELPAKKREIEQIIEKFKLRELYAEA